MRSSAIRRSASIALLYGGVPLSWVSSDIGIFECVTKEGLVKDAIEKEAHLSHVFLPLAFYHVAITRKITSMALGFEPSGLTSTTFLSSDVLHTPNSSHGQIFNRNNMLMDRIHDTYMTPDTSSMVCVSTIICALKSSVPFCPEHTVLSSGAST
jgi:hypothetical protein